MSALSSSQGEVMHGSMERALGRVVVSVEKMLTEEVSEQRGDDSEAETASLRRKPTARARQAPHQWGSPNAAG